MAQKPAPKGKDAAAAAAGGAAAAGKPWLLIGGIVLVAIGGSVAGTIFMLGGDAEAKPAAAAADAVPAKALYRSLRPAFQVNFTVAQKPRVLQTELTVVSRDAAVIDALTQHEPLVRSRLLDFIGTQDYLALTTEGGRTAFREAARDLLDKVLEEQGAAPGVESVLLTGFVMQ